MITSRIALAQINPTVGDLAGNVRLIEEAYRQAQETGVELVVFPECCVIGYPAEDLVLMPGFQDAAMQAVQTLADITAGQVAAMLVGSLWREEDGTLYNAAILLEHGSIHSVTRKHALPNEGVFDEQRVFMSAPVPDCVSWRGHLLGIIVCKDIWEPDIVARLAGQGAEVLIAINASPYERGKQERREAVVRQAAITHRIPAIYLNQSGGQDELAFDGASFVMQPDGRKSHQLPVFEEVVVSLSSISSDVMPWDETAVMYAAMMTGLRDYVEKNGFNGVVIGLSGGIDSALTAVVAVDALGAERVHTVMLPSPYTSDISLEDAQALAQALKVRYDVLPIDAGMQAADAMLAPLSPEVPNALAKENIQSRLRGLLLMAISNSTGALLVTTGNKSELATGYATLYGDMCGAYSVLKDVYKTDVFALSRWRNVQRPAGAKGAPGALISERIITRPPSAELRADQKDEDSLPPYEVLDAILRCMIEERLGSEAIIAQGYDADTVRQVATLLRRSEYKRRQSPPGVKLTPMSFGRDWRMPLTSRFGR